MTERNPQISSHIIPILILISLTAACLIPFAGKAFNIDEPLFVWVARQIQAHPLDFYGFRINWYGTEMDAARIIKNPPFASYYTALAGSLAGWDETPLHLAFLLPAVAAATGTYFLAREFTQHPLTATLIGILSPVFLLSSTTVMCDTMMLAFYVWAIYFWIRGIKNDRWYDLAIAALLITLCSLTKYFGVSLIPLLFLFTLTTGGGKRHRALFLLIPVVFLCLYQWGTYVLYGRGLLSDAASYASKEKDIHLGTVAPSLIAGLSFTGGCLISTLFFAGKAWHKRVIVAGMLALPLAALAFSRINFPHVAENASWGYYLQLAFLAVAGVNILALAGLDYWRDKCPESLFLLLWLLGTFVFASIVNWSANGRSILPMAPAAGIVVVRFLEKKLGQSWQPDLKQLAVPLTGAWMISMLVTWADFSLAESARTAAKVIGRTYGGSAKPLWFQGHWGFQYYMEKNRGIAYDRKHSTIRPGDLMVVAENNTNAFPDILAQASPVQVLRFKTLSFLTTMNYNAGAGYYSSGFGPLPFLLDKGLDESYHIVSFPPSR